MTELFDKAVLICMGLEKKAKDLLDELEKNGKTSQETQGGAEGQGLTGKQMVENKVVEDGVNALKEFLGFVKGGKEKLEKEFATSSEKVLERLNVATQTDIEITREMARVAREKVEKLEKRIEELESRLPGQGTQGA